MKKKFLLAATVAASSLAIALTGCSGGTQASSSGGGKTFTVGIVPKTLQNPVWQGVIKGADDEAKALGNVKIKTAASNTEEDIAGQINKIQDLITGGIDALVVAPNGDSLQPVLQQAISQGIPVVLIDTDIPTWKDKTSFVTSQQSESSAKVNEEIAKALGGSASGAEVGILDFPGNNTVQARVDAAKKVFQQTGMKIVSELPGKCDRATALNSATDMLTANPNIKAIFGGCGQGATGAAQAVQNANKNVLVTGFDGINDEFNAVKSGKMLATILQDFPAIGKQALDAAVDAKNGKTVQKTYEVPGILITKDNIDKYKPAG
ncbi:sugar ABC transporter substrate-binding protein [Arthrobacter sp. M4]|uniref:sugar ABC transporter substrate-binding protein n=1 Tax=Arthrobacter sp. M4 TaxID=218160 RepID=UPI001CDB7D8F|nr:sugar ABC transporter substrate-binding protein [Arthrobacter sp. M4]MCA4132541.1 sugar ABC transporter substrate-binding protein [Arthrobacter sp. M4]